MTDRNIPNYTQLLRLWDYVSSMATENLISDSATDPVKVLRNTIIEQMIWANRAVSAGVEKLYQQGRVDAINELVNGKT